MKILINGINGKMGQEVANVLDNDKDIVLVGGVDKENTGIYTYPVYTNVSQIEEKPDVIIDFSVPVATLNILSYAKENNIPVVIATTGFTKEQLNTINEYSKHIPIFKSANMSYDINLMAKIVASLSKSLPNTDIEIIETHHNRKIDSPSGTALFLADSINEANNNKINIANTNDGMETPITEITVAIVSQIVFLCNAANTPKNIPITVPIITAHKP